MVCLHATPPRASPGGRRGAPRRSPANGREQIPTPMGIPSPRDRPRARDGDALGLMRQRREGGGLGAGGHGVGRGRIRPIRPPAASSSAGFRHLTYLSGYRRLRSVGAGVCPSGQREQTVNLSASCLRWFESTRSHSPRPVCPGPVCACSRPLPREASRSSERWMTWRRAGCRSAGADWRRRCLSRRSSRSGSPRRSPRRGRSGRRSSRPGGW